MDIGYKDADGNLSFPTPKQLDYADAIGPSKHTLFAGGLGTGKSDAMCLEAAVQSRLYKNNLGLMGRKVLDAFKKTTLVQLLDMFGAYVYRHNANDHEITMIDGSKIIYLALDDSRDAMQRIKSLNLGWFAFDQLEEVPEATFEAAAGQLRRKGSQRVSFHTSNPAGHNWNWKRFKRDAKGSIYDNENFALIEAQTWPPGVPPPKTQSDVRAYSSNPYLPPDYIRWLLTRPKLWVNRYVYCSWDDFSGLIYPMFDENLHVIKPWPLRTWWYRYVVYDYGFQNPSCILFAAVDDRKTIYIYDIIYEERTYISDLAGLIRDRVKREPVDKRFWLADPSIMRTERDGITIADEWENHGIYWGLANNDKRVGIDRVARYLTPDESNNCKLYFFDVPGMRPLVNEMLEYHWKELRYGRDDKELPEEPIKRKDHAMDCLRYLVHEVMDSPRPKAEFDFGSGWGEGSYAQNAKHAWMRE